MKIVPSLLSFIKNHPFFSALIGLFIIVTVPFFFLLGNTHQSTTPPQRIKTVTPIPPQSSFEGSTYNPVFTDPLPTSATIYSLSLQPLTTEELTKIANSFGFFSEPQLLGEDYYWTGKERLPVLQINPKNGYVSYIAPTAPTEQLQITTPNQIIPTALQLVKEKNINTTDLNMDSPLVQYIEEFSEQPNFTQDFNLAKVFLVSFPQQVNGVNIYRQYGQTSNVTVIFDQQGSLKQISYYVINTTPNPVSQVKLLTSEELKKVITNGNGIVRQPFSSNTVSGEDLRGLTFILKRAELGYLIDPDANILQPIFVTTGIVEKNGTPAREAIIYVPAVR